MSWANFKPCIFMSDIKTHFRSPTLFQLCWLQHTSVTGLFPLLVRNSPWKVSQNYGISNILGPSMQFSAINSTSQVYLIVIILNTRNYLIYFIDLLRFKLFFNIWSSLQKLPWATKKHLDIQFCRYLQVHLIYNGFQLQCLCHFIHLFVCLLSGKHLVKVKVGYWSHLVLLCWVILWINARLIHTQVQCMYIFLILISS